MRRRYGTRPYRYKRKRYYRRKRLPATVLDRLTGGSGDVNPQLLSGKVEMSVLNTQAVEEINMPIVRYISGGKGAKVIELLKGFCVMKDFEDTTAHMSIRCFLCTSQPEVTIHYDDPSVIMAWWIGVHHTAGENMALPPQPLECNVTDQQGHGIIVGKDKLYLVVQSAGMTNANLSTAYVKLLYRFKKVPMSEYIGIVQQQT